MRFKLGVAIGFAIGYWVGNVPPQQRRAKIDEAWSGVRENPRLKRVSDTVSKDAHRLGDAVEQKLVDAADGAVGAISGTVKRGDRSGASGSSASGSSASGSSASGKSGSSQAGAV